MAAAQAISIDAADRIVIPGPGCNRPPNNAGSWRAICNPDIGDILDSLGGGGTGASNGGGIGDILDSLGQGGKG